MRYLRRSALSTIFFAARVLSLFSSLVFCLRPALAVASSEQSNPLAQYQNAALVQHLVREMQSPTISNELRAQLLDSSRPEDLAYAKSLIVGWKSLHLNRTSAEFDELVSFDSRGHEVLRIKRLDDPQTFLINGRPWVAPNNGSISQSLRQHLEWSKDESAEQQSPSHRRKYKSVAKAILFSASVSRAARESVGLAPAYLVASTHSGGIFSATGAVRALPPAVVGKYKLFDDLGPLVGIRVQCRDGGASGHTSVLGNRLQFESRRDGSVVVTLEDAEKTKLLVTPQIVDRRKLANERLANLNAFTSGNVPAKKREAFAKQIFQDFTARTATLGLNDGIYRSTWKEITEASYPILNGGTYADAVVKTAAQLKYFYESRKQVIVTETLSVSKCTDKNCVATEDTRISTSIQPWLPPKKPQMLHAASVMNFQDPRTEKQKDENLIRGNLLSLRPLGACCNDSACRNHLLEQGIKLTPAKATAQ